MVELGAGATPITATVTAEDGTTTRTYVITVTREASNNAALRELSVSGIGVDERFIVDAAATQRSFSFVAPFAASSVTVMARTSDSNATLMVTSSDTVADSITTVAADSDTPGSYSVLLAPRTEGGDIVINITVTAEDGTTTQAYAITATRTPASKDAKLSELRVLVGGSSQPLTPPFDAAGTTMQHSIVFPFAVDVVTVEAVTSDSKATREIMPADDDTGTVGHQVRLTEGVPRLIEIERYRREWRHRGLLDHRDAQFVCKRGLARLARVGDWRRRRRAGHRRVRRGHVGLRFDCRAVVGGRGNGCLRRPPAMRRRWTSRG